MDAPSLPKSRALSSRLLVLAPRTRFLWLPAVMKGKRVMHLIATCSMIILRVWAMCVADRVRSQRIVSWAWCILVALEVVGEVMTGFAEEHELSLAMAVTWRYVASYSLFYAWTGAIIPTLGLPFTAQVLVHSHPRKRAPHVRPAGMLGGVMVRCAGIGRLLRVQL